MATASVPEPKVSEAPPTTYRAAVVHKFGSPLTVEQVPMAKLEPGQVRVKVEVCGLCHTDIHAANGDWPIKPSPPFVPGHEGVGIVTELAPGEAPSVTSPTRSASVTALRCPGSATPVATVTTARPRGSARRLHP
jgi:NADPH:quinone reductase-like Zn-dependent oxidoreductase